MAQETGHAVNLANFQQLISHVSQMGNIYNPINPLIQLQALQTKYNEGLQVTGNLQEAKAHYKHATNLREIEFKKMQPLVIRMVSMLEAVGASPLTVKDARGILRKIRGARAVKINKSDSAAQNPPEIGEELSQETSPTKAIKHISVSQRSFDSLLQHFGRMVGLLSQESNYNPNEAELSIAALQSTYELLDASIKDVSMKLALYHAALMERDRCFYAEGTGIVHLATQVKFYTSSVFGNTSPTTKLIRKIPFRKSF